MPAQHEVISRSGKEGQMVERNSHKGKEIEIKLRGSALKICEEKAGVVIYLDKKKHFLLFEDDQENRYKWDLSSKKERDFVRKALEEAEEAEGMKNE